MDPYHVKTVQTLWRSVDYVRNGIADNADIQRFLTCIPHTLAELERALKSASLAAHQKRICQTSYGQLVSIQRILQNCLQKSGGELHQPAVSISGKNDNISIISNPVNDAETITWDDGISAFQKNIKSGVITNVRYLDVITFMTDAATLFEEKIKEALREHNSLKVDTVLAAEYSIVKNDEETIEIKYFNTKSHPTFQTTDLKEWFADNVKQPIERDMEEFQERDSGWTLRSILNLTINIKKLQPLHAGSYIELPKEIQNKKACVNVRNNDDKCFMWAVLSALHPAKYSADRVNNYTQFENELNFDKIDFPMPPQQISRFEKQNNVSINLFMLNNKGKSYEATPCHLTAEKKEKHVNLLLIQDFDTKVPRFHYVWIKNLPALIFSQVSKKKVKKYVCDRCLHYFHNVDALKVHEVDCSSMNKCKIVLPQSDKDKILEFKNFSHKERVAIVVYADFECVLKPVEDEHAYQEHEPFSVGFYVQYAHDASKSKYFSYRKKTEQEENPAKWFVEELYKLAKELEEMHKNPRPMTNLDEKAFRQATVCHICQKPYSAKDVKVRDHCHLTGRYRGAAHNSCNLNYQDSKTIPVVFHNLSGYDSHLFIKELANTFEGSINLIPENKEKYISFTKSVNGSMISFRFIDSFRFMPSSLDKLASYLGELDIVEREFNNEYSSMQIELLKRKGVFPYDYISSLDKLNVTTLPDKNSFYSKLYDANITDEEYNHAQKVWTTFNVKTLGDYSDIYLKTDVLLLANVFEDFRNNCLSTYQLDPAHYYTTPGLTWDAMLKYTQIKLELLTDIDMLLFVERGIRGGVSQCSNRYAKANNHYTTEDYHPEEESKYIMYYDINNLYGWAMTQSLPYGGFKWVEDVSNANFFMVDDDSPIGYILEVDLEYPEELHDTHKDLPFCPEHQAPPGSKQKKLLTTLHDKERYVIHYVALKQALKHGLRLKKIHRVLQFNQKPWLKPYIDLNSEKRKNSKNEFEKMLYKLFNNAVYGKTMENERKRVDVKLVDRWEERYGAEMYIALPNFHSCAVFDENLVAIQLARTKIKICKPIYIGLSVLDLSKTLIYRFHYEYMQNRVGDKSKLLYTDTDSLVYEIKGINVYEMMKADLDEFDTSDYPVDNQFNIPLVNKKKVGLMKDEANGKIITEFVGLRSKMYSVKIQGSNTIKKAKGVKTSVVKSNINFDDYLSCLRNNTTKTCEQNNIRSRLHVLRTEKQTKIGLSPHDDKRCLLTNQTDTLPWGHYACVEILNQAAVVGESEYRRSQGSTEDTRSLQLAERSRQYTADSSCEDSSEPREKRRRVAD